jgi:hypothetical protein
MYSAVHMPVLSSTCSSVSATVAMSLVIASCLLAACTLTSYTGAAYSMCTNVNMRFCFVCMYAIFDECTEWTV